jgi:hypothetical protein
MAMSDDARDAWEAAKDKMDEMGDQLGDSDAPREQGFGEQLGEPDVSGTESLNEHMSDESLADVSADMETEPTAAGEGFGERLETPSDPPVEDYDTDSETFDTQA